PVRAQSPVQIVALGASNTAGWGVAPDEAYPSALQRLLKAKGVDAAMVNAGIPGDTTAGMLGRLEGVLTADTRVVILQPGTYVFSRISLGIGSYLQYDPDGQVDMPVGIAGEMPMGGLEQVIVHTDNLDMARGAIIAQGDVRLSTHLKMYVRSTSSVIKVSPEGYFHGSLIAPSARVTLMNGSTMVGSVYARNIDVAETAAFESHTLAELPKPDGTGFGALMAGPANPDDAAAPVDLGLVFELGQNTPNPFRPSTTIRFALPSEREVELRVFDVAGRAVKTLADGPLAAGVHTLQWNGTDDQGARLSSGVYFYRLTAGNDRAQRKMVIVE
ncbi:MAG: FlgD immunoglobulin-like domain containing protein, partial [Candidatus Eisenbacteria bacterium]